MKNIRDFKSMFKIILLLLEGNFMKNMNVYEKLLLFILI